MKSIGIVSIKGGVGKTSTVVSLGAAMSSLGKKVLLVDANLSAPNLGLHLGILKPKHGLQDVLLNKVSIENAIQKQEFFDVLPASLYKQKISNPLRLKNKLRQLKDKYDVILIDSSPSLDDETLAAMMASDELLVVTTPDMPTLYTTMIAVKLAKQKNTPIKGLILNKVHNKNFELSITQIEKETGAPVLAVLPYDINVLESLANQTPFPEYKKNAEGAIEYTKLAAALLGENYKENFFTSLFKRFFRISPKTQDFNRASMFYESIFSKALK